MVPIPTIFASISGMECHAAFPVSVNRRGHNRGDASVRPAFDQLDVSILSLHDFFKPVLDGPRQESAPEDVFFRQLRSVVWNTSFWRGHRKVSAPRQ